MIYMRLQNLQQACIAGQYPGLSCLIFSVLRISNPQSEIIFVKIDHALVFQGSQLPGHGAAVDTQVFCHLGSPQGQAEGRLSLPLCFHGQIGEDLFPHRALR